MDIDEKIGIEVKNALNRAEKIWDEVGSEFRILNEKAFSEQKEIPTNIPGHFKIILDKPEVANFITLVLDIRDSTNHLLIAREGKVSQLNRVFFETTAINAAGAIVINHYNGGLTEYLGDGFLALFNVKNEKDPNNNVYEAYNAANCLLNKALGIVNKELFDRYKLKELKIGIGMAYSKAIVTTVGINDNLHPKVIGECVYRATKLSSGTNNICIDKHLKLLWPKKKNGLLCFNPFKLNDIEAFEIVKKS